MPEETFEVKEEIPSVGASSIQLAGLMSVDDKVFPLLGGIPYFDYFNCQFM